MGIARSTGKWRSVGESMIQFFDASDLVFRDCTTKCTMKFGWSPYGIY